MPRLRRVPSRERPDWMAQADRLGYDYYRNSDGSFAWREDVRYEFDASALALIRKVTETLHDLCLDVVQDAVGREGGLDEFFIPRAVQDTVRQSWQRRDPFVIGRFDLAWCGGQPKLIEYNADTPATLPESTRMQTVWHRRRGWPHTHAALDAALLTDRLRHLRQKGLIHHTVHIVPYPDNTEDRTHALFYRQWAEEAGLNAIHCELKDLEIELPRVLWRQNDPRGKKNS
ncbi:glutathionylspermidine synthase family protein [Acetobacter sp. AN02]|uniref:glutathionylspermidine synthase family protein n=1 Tax=Acetobacter sp. AN02 TaxID=2894186 RepID=UPI0024342708|nr:glutathionylspermidine synthase family protein [Acetobacter sp. AN02]MDG6095468.1 glutathionylspermidine synthase family protein [Acetobacter sp. AN02]